MRRNPKSVGRGSCRAHFSASEGGEEPAQSSDKASAARANPLRIDRGTTRCVMASAAAPMAVIQAAPHPLRPRKLGLSLAPPFFMACCAFAQADEPKKVPAGITAIEPAALVTGCTATLKIRGFKLKEATELRFPKAPAVKVAIKEKKDAAQPTGLENNVVGESQIMVELTLPADLPAGLLEFSIATPAGDAAGRITVIGPAAVVDEKEPNNGFREVQKLEPGRSARGTIGKDKDVDVYEVAGKAGQKLKVSVTGGSALLMDAALTCYDSHGHVLATSDDVDGRNPSLLLTPAADSPVFLCVSDAHDKGGEWHTYLLTVEETK